MIVSLFSSLTSSLASTTMRDGGALSGGAAHAGGDAASSATPNPTMARANPTMARANPTMAKRPRMGRTRAGRIRIGRTPMRGAGAVAMQGAPRIRRGSRAASSMRRESIGLASKPSASTSHRPGRAARPGESTRKIPDPAKPSPYRVAYVLTLLVPEEPVSDQWKPSDGDNGHGSRLLLRHMEHAPFILHSPAVQTMSGFYVFYSFTIERGATKLTGDDRPPIGPPGPARVDGVHEFKILN